MRLPSPLLVPAFISVGFLWLWPHLLSADALGIHASFRTVWADFAAHLTFAQRFARFPPELWFDHTPLLHGVRFDYPFLTGLVSGGVLRLTDSEVAALLVPTMFAAVVLPWVIYAFLRTSGTSPAWSAVGTLVFYLGGGLGWIAVLNNDFAIQPYSEASMVQGTLFQFGRLVHLLLPQRALQLGLPIGLLVIIGLARLMSRPPTMPIRAAEGQVATGSPGLLSQTLLGTSAGLLYAVHVHSFIAVAVATAVMVIATVIPTRSDRSIPDQRVDAWKAARFAPFAITATLTSVTLMIWLSGGSLREGFLQWDPGWLANNVTGWLGLWWSNGGIFYLAAAYALFTRRLWRSRLAASCAVAGWILFAILNLVRLQPWDWDNTKLEIWSFVFLLPGVLLLMQSWWEIGTATQRPIGKLRRSATLIAVLSLIPTGILDLKQVLSFHRHTNMMWSTEQRELASTLRDLASPGDLILTVDKPHDWVSGLAGGQILLGYTGWLWSYGIDSADRQNEVRTMFQGGDPALALLRHYQVAWAVLDDEARRRYDADADFFARHFQVAFRHGDTTVYDLRPGAARPTTP